MAGGAVVAAICSQDLGHVGLAQPRGRLDQRIEHGLQLDAGPADDLQHIGCCRRCSRASSSWRSSLATWPLDGGADFMITFAELCSLPFRPRVAASTWAALCGLCQIILCALDFLLTKLIVGFWPKAALRIVARAPQSGHYSL